MSKKNRVISFFKKGKSISPGLPFLQFCKKYDICNQHQLTSGCSYGKKAQIRKCAKFDSDPYDITSFPWSGIVSIDHNKCYIWDNRWISQVSTNLIRFDRYQKSELWTKLYSGSIKPPNSWFVIYLYILSVCNQNKILTPHVLLYYKSILADLYFLNPLFHF